MGPLSLWSSRPSGPLAALPAPTPGAGDPIECPSAKMSTNEHKIVPPITNPFLIRSSLNLFLEKLHCIELDNESAKAQSIDFTGENPSRLPLGGGRAHCVPIRVEIALRGCNRAGFQPLQIFRASRLKTKVLEFRTASFTYLCEGFDDT